VCFHEIYVFYCLIYISTCKTRYLLRDVMYTFGNQMEVSVPSDQSTSAIRLKDNIVNWAIKTLINVANENGGGDTRDAEIRRQVNNLHTHTLPKTFIYGVPTSIKRSLSLSRLSWLNVLHIDIYHLLLIFFLFGNMKRELCRPPATRVCSTSYASEGQSIRSRKILRKILRVQL
jgi:hypothetical protein